MRHGYSYEAVLSRVKEKVRLEFGGPGDRRQKAIYEDPRVAMTKDAWSRKIRGETRFTFEELDKVADFFGASHGWPFIDWHYAEALRNANARRAEAEPGAPPGPGTASPSGRPGKRSTGGHHP